MQVKDVRISLVEMTDHVLSMYDLEISRYTAGRLVAVHAGLAAGLC